MKNKQMDQELLAALMPRKARVGAPGALHHIIIRRIERKPIFKDKIDYGNFIARWGKILVVTGTACFAWALITNHARFLLRSGDVGFIYPDEEITNRVCGEIQTGGIKDTGRLALD